MLCISTYVGTYPVIEMEDTDYFVVGRCTTGSRHYSESLTLSAAFEMFETYKGLVEYFGGGTVELIAHRGDVNLMIKSAMI